MNLDIEGKELFYELCHRLASLKLYAGKRGKESIPFSFPAVIKGAFPGANGQFAAVQYLGGESALKHNEARGVVLRFYLTRLQSVGVDQVIIDQPLYRTRLKGPVRSPYYEYIFTDPLATVQPLIDELFSKLEVIMREQIGPLFDELPVHSIPVREWKQKYFNELTTEELYHILQARVEVFVIEQGCIHQEIDQFDIEAMHIFLEERGEVLAYMRLLPRKTEHDEASIGKMLVRKKYRGRGYAKEMMRQAVDFLQFDWNEQVIKLQTRDHQKDFYQSFGFKEIASSQLDESLLHINMQLEHR
ncbi:putative GNAT family N-acyltransferase [Bacillus ectoiniformans]|uniref:GNAT family N-acetyltransferase n=1 Tax=Bacillus ectoiniformans TaxID=1494429 RepID=UPI001957D86E|nr:GNAT family N-acetyltransferase [Bacillus ectoiniformans]MBM7649209.1 putative GNAT family N-acyltransferase [Bacillus ectoiniformans]